MGFRELSGEELDEKYRSERELGKGGMGSVEKQKASGESKGRWQSRSGHRSRDAVEIAQIPDGRLRYFFKWVF